MPTADHRASDSVLVVVEREAACALWSADWGPAPDAGWTLLEQEEWEPAEQFAERLQTTLLRETSDATRPTVLLVTSGLDDDAASSEHWSLSSSILGHFTVNGGGRLILTTGYGAPRCDSLESLAEELSDEWASASVSVGVRSGRVTKAPEARRSVSTGVRDLRWSGSDHSALAQ
jgi:hypothetical protein